MTSKNIFQAIGSGFKPSSLRTAGNYLSKKGEISGPMVVLALVAVGILYALLYQPYSTASNIRPITMKPTQCNSTTVKMPAKVSSPTGTGAILNVYVARDGSMVERESGLLAIQKGHLCPGSILAMHATQFVGSNGQALPVDQVSSWAQVDNAGTSITVWMAVAPRYGAVSGADAYTGAVVLDSLSAQGADIPVSIHVAYQNLNLIFAFGFLAAFGGFTWAWLLHNATHGVRKPGYFWRHSLLCLAVLLAASIPIVDAQVLNKPDWQGTLIQYITLATLIGGTAIAATPTLRALALPANLGDDPAQNGTHGPQLSKTRQRKRNR